jgi:mannose-1-phosphate guanylyltransferase
LLPIGPGGETLLGAAVRRARAIAGERVVIVTAESQLAATSAIVPGIEVIGEPVGRNTAAAIGLAAAVIALRDPDAVIAVLPADQHVTDEAGLTRVLELGLAAAERDDVIGTLGITPTRAETGFGYLEVEAATPNTITPVLRFVEKPDRETAEHYVASGKYLWNAGMFFASARRLLSELDKHLAPTGQAVRDIAAGNVPAEEVYSTLASISIDHAVMERVTRVVTIPASVGWDDVGSWAALPALLEPDSAGNAVVGDALSLDSKNNIVFNDGDGLIVAVGVDDLVIVKSGDAILVMPRSAAQNVRGVVDELAKRGLSKYL